ESGGTGEGAQLRSSSARSWNMPQSIRIRTPSVSRQYRLPVTCRLAPKNESFTQTSWQEELLRWPRIVGDGRVASKGPAAAGGVHEHEFAHREPIWPLVRPASVGAAHRPARRIPRAARPLGRPAAASGPSCTGGGPTGKRGVRTARNRQGARGGSPADDSFRSSADRSSRTA